MMTTKKLNKEIAQLTQSLRRMVGGSPRSAGPSRARPAAPVQVIVSGKKKSRGKRPAPGIPGSSASGSSREGLTFSINHSEILYVVTTGDDGTLKTFVDLRPAGTRNGAGYLTAQASLHERMRWNSLTLEFVGAVGTTVGGVIIMGVDWTSSVTEPTLEKVVALTPNKQCAVWDKMRLVVPMKAMQAQKWLSLRTDSEADHGQLCIFIQGAPKSQGIGYIRMTYSVSMAGTVVP